MRQKRARRCPWIDALVNTLVITRARLAARGRRDQRVCAGAGHSPSQAGSVRQELTTEAADVVVVSVSCHALLVKRSAGPERVHLIGRDEPPAQSMADYYGDLGG